MRKEELLEVGREKLRISRFQEAQDAYVSAIALDSDNGDAWYGKATALEGLGRYDEAIEAFERAASLAPEGRGGRSRFGIANNRVRLGQLDRALDEFAAALAIDPGLERAWHNRACVFLDLGRLDDAAKDFARAAALDPEDVRIALLQGYCLAQLGHQMEAEACFARAEVTRNRSDLARVWYEIGSRTYFSRRPEAALGAFERASRMNPGWGTPWLGRGMALLRLGRDDDALASFDRAIAARDEALLLGWSAKADFLVARGRMSAAHDAYARVVAVLPRTSGDYRAQGRAHRKLGQYDLALIALAKAHALERSDPLVLMEQAICLEEGGRAQEATSVLEIAVTRFPTFAEGWRRLANRMSETGEHERAVEYAEKAILLGESRSALQWTIGCSLLALQRFDAAEAFLVGTVAEKPRMAEAWFNLAICRLRLGKEEECLSALDRTLALSPDMYAALRGKCDVLQKLGRMKEADSIAALGLAMEALSAEPQQAQVGVNRLQQAIALDPNNLLACRQLGELLFQANQLLEQAEGYFARWTEAWPEDESAWQIRAQLLKKLGRGPEATACHAKGIAANPRSARALRNAAMDALANERYEDALAFVERSLQIEGENSNGLFALGLCRARTGKMPEAVDAFRQAVAIDPKDIEAWKEVTACLVLLARYGEAAEAWKKVLALDPTVDPFAGIGGPENVPVLVPGTSNVYVLDEGSMATEKTRLGTALLARDDYRGAAEAFDAALRLDPGMTDAWVERGICAEVLEGPEQAIAFFDRALALDAELVRALYNKGVSLQRLDKREEAIHAYEHVLAIHRAKELPVDTDYVHACYNLGLALLARGELESALDCFDEVLTVERGEPGSWQEEARRARERKTHVYFAASKSA